jgi:hypothetical protein
MEIIPRLENEKKKTDQNQSPSQSMKLARVRQEQETQKARDLQERVELEAAIPALEHEEMLCLERLQNSRKSWKRCQVYKKR